MRAPQQQDAQSSVQSAKKESAKLKSTNATKVNEDEADLFGLVRYSLLFPSTASHIIKIH